MRDRNRRLRRATAFIICALLCEASLHAQECRDVAQARESVTVDYGVNAMRAVFTPSDDGAVRATEATSGRLLWTYRIKEAATVEGSYMTDLRVLRFDANRDDTIDISAGDRVWLYFGVRRAGAAYYALDVTDPSAARDLWHIGPDALPGAGEAWSTPTIARIRIAGETQNGERFVLVLGGGYDSRMNNSGNRLFIIDAASGRLLWSTAGASSGTGAGTPDLLLARMRYPVAARVNAVDTDSDGFADRLYAADLGGQVWRFDIWNGKPRSTLVTGGVLASLGSANPSPSTALEAPSALPAGADARRFFVAPDAALIWFQGYGSYYNIAIGSGDVAASDPSATVTHDRFYSLRDRNPFTALTQPAYDAAIPVVDAGLFDITSAPDDSHVPAEAPGWKLDLRSGSSWSGERVVGESVTASGIVLFTTLQPGTTGCEADGSSRVYALKVDTAQTALDFNDDGAVTREDRSMPLSSPGIPGELHLERIPPLTEGSGSPPIGSPPTQGDEASPLPATRCRAGTEVLAHCVSLPSLRRTFWRRHATN